MLQLPHDENPGEKENEMKFEKNDEPNKDLNRTENENVNVLNEDGKDKESSNPASSTENSLPARITELPEISSELNSKDETSSKNLGGSTSSLSNESCTSVSTRSDISGSTVKSRNMYRPRCFTRNPITGTVTEEIPNNFRPKVTISVCKGITVDSKGDDGIDYSHIHFTQNPKSQVRRNPITGEGLGSCPVHSRNFLRSGIRITQPPGGISSGIF